MTNTRNISHSGHVNLNIWNENVENAYLFLECKNLWIIIMDISGNLILGKLISNTNVFVYMKGFIRGFFIINVKGKCRYLSILVIIYYETFGSM